MKKLIALVLCLALPALAADLKLEADAGSAGFVDAKNIEISTVPGGTKVTVCLILENLDFTLAGAEYTVTFPTWLTLINISAVGTGDPPYKIDTTATGLDTANVQKLPADGTGADTATTFDNNRGRARIGFVITETADRPNSGASRILAKMDFLIGRDYDISGSARTEATCISASEVITVINSSTGSSLDPIFADDTASAVAVNGSGADLEVNLTNSTTTIIKGDVNKSGALTTLDVGPLIQCAVFGQASALCPWSADSLTDYLIAADINCSGAVSTLDVGPGINRALGNFSFLKANLSEFYTLSSEKGVLQVSGEGKPGFVTSVDFAVKGNIQFGELALDAAAEKEGWSVVGHYFAERGVYRYLLFNAQGVDSLLPNLQIPYEAQAGAQIAIRGVESYLSDNTMVEYMPSIEEFSILSEKETGKNQNRK